MSKAVSRVETDQVKDFKVLKCDQGALFRVGLDGGGVVPDMLSGLYTSIKAAEFDIKKYLSQRG